MAKTSLFIPTRDSARWIGVLLDAYRKLGVEPLYVVDGRSTDNTLDILHRKHANFVSFIPSGDFVECGMIEHGALACETDWVMRLDDDEFPSVKLAEVLLRADFAHHGQAVSAARFEVSRVDGKFGKTIWPSRLWLGGQYDVYNPLLRIFDRTAVSFEQKVHTSGLSVHGTISHLPEEFYFLHFNNIIRNLVERVAKVRLYASASPKLAWRYAEESLPELVPEGLHYFINEGIGEYKSLISELYSRRNPDDIVGQTLTSDEKYALIKGMVVSALDSLQNAQSAYMRARNERSDLQTKIQFLQNSIISQSI